MAELIPGVIVKLASQEFVVPPLSLGSLSRLQKQIQSFDGSISEAAVNTTLDVAVAAISRNYPQITREELAEIIDVGNMAEVWTAVMDVSGMRRKEQEAQQSEGKSIGAS